MTDFIGTVPLLEWLGGGVPDDQQARRFRASPDPQALAEAVASNASKPSLSWCRCCDKLACWRAELRFVVPFDLFDQFFNGPAGYRAQYYRSPAEGQAYNDQAVGRLIPVARSAFELGTFSIDWPTVERSLQGRWSKIWIADERAFQDAEAPRGPERWTARNTVGARLPFPSQPALAVYGTFIDPLSGEEWVSALKRDRAADIHQKGFS